MTHIVKRRGHRQEFDERKIYASVYAACINTSLEKEEAEKIANKVAASIKSWVKDKEEVSSSDIFEKAEATLEEINPDVAFMYKTHRDIS